MFILVLLSFQVNTCDLTLERWPSHPKILELVACMNASPPGNCLSAIADAPSFAIVGQQVTLDASQSSVLFDPQERTFSWVQVDTGAPTVTIENANQAIATFTPSEPGLYQFEVEAEWHCRFDKTQVETTVEVFHTPTQINAELVFTEPSDTVVQVTHAASGDDRLFVVLKSGQVVISQGGTVLAQPFLDISSLVSSSSEQGLLGIAFDPDYPTNGVVYVNYTGQTPSATGSTWDTRIVAWQRDPMDPDRVDPDAHFLLMSVDQPEQNHNGGQLLFGPDGYLYIGLGDGGGAGDVHGSIGNGQDPLTLLGKMLRIEVNGLAPYTIPVDNPFVGEPGTLDEIWALGLRNPWRFSFDRQTGDLYIADVGQNAWEEVNFQSHLSMGGENYGWRLKEGFACFNPSTNCDPGGLTDPVLVYSHGGTPFRCSITGGFVYRGPSVPALNGHYLYGDYCSSQVWTLIFHDGSWQSQLLEVFVDDASLGESVIAFGEDHLGEVYICTRTGGNANVYKILDER